MARQNLDILIQNNKEQILKWIEERKSKTWIAETLKCDRGSFRKALERNGINYKGQQGDPKFDIQGKQFGNLIVLKPVDKSELTESQKLQKGIYWYCKCIKCGKTSIVRGIALRSGNTIGDGCERSKGELKIKNILEENNILYKKEFSFLDCIITSNPAKFDFAILDENKTVKYLIEYDGKQHFENCYDGWKQSKEDFKKRKESDKIKNQYCLNNNIPLIRIPYTIYETLNIQDLLLETTQYLLKKE